MWKVLAVFKRKSSISCTNQLGIAFHSLISIFLSVFGTVQVQHKFRCYFVCKLHPLKLCSLLELFLPSSCWRWRRPWPISDWRCQSRVGISKQGGNQSTIAIVRTVLHRYHILETSIYHDFEEKIIKNIPSSQM